MKALLSLIILVLLVACSAPAAGPPPIDMQPVGDGLSVIGFALIGMAVVVTVGRFLS